jgi:hypothetical protein
MVVEVVEGHYPAEFINGAVFEGLGFRRAFLYYP